MDHQEMLKSLNLSEHDLKDLLRRFKEFFYFLNEAQKAAVLRSLPSADEAAKTLGPDVTAEQLQRFLIASGPHPEDDGGTFMFEGALQIKNRE